MNLLFIKTFAIHSERGDLIMLKTFSKDSSIHLVNKPLNDVILYKATWLHLSTSSQLNAIRSGRFFFLQKIRNLYSSDKCPLKRHHILIFHPLNLVFVSLLHTYELNIKYTDKKKLRAGHKNIRARSNNVTLECSFTIFNIPTVCNHTRCTQCKYFILNKPLHRTCHMT